MPELLVMEAALQSRPDVRRLAAGWMLLALGALTISTLCAVLLIAARTPWLGAPSGAGALFGRALVLHVSLAVVVWFLACAAALWTIAAGAAVGWLHRLALALAALGLAAMVLALFLETGQPVLANYVPVLEHPVFFTGLGLFALGVALCAGLCASAMGSAVRDGPVWRMGAFLSILVVFFVILASVASLGLALEQTGAAHFEVLAWGPGHLLQFMHVILMMSVWMVLGEQVLGQSIAPRRWLAGVLLLAAAPVLVAPVIYASYPMSSAEFRRAFTLLMAFGAWPGATLLALRLLWQMWRAGRSVWSFPQTPALLLSVLLFLTGCVLGAMIRNDSTMVPAHYHGTVGAVTLAYMALGYRLLPSFGATLSGAALLRWQPVVYGVGLMVLALALAWSGALGVPRKTLHVEVMVQYPSYFAAMGLAGLGGLLAILGAALFVFNVLRSLREGLKSVAEPPPVRRDVRRTAMVSTLGLIALMGALLAYWPHDQGAVVAPQTPNTGLDASAHAVQMRKEEIDRRFFQGAALLNARQFDAAASELHRVLELAPKMPEAQVNMGFAMIGLQRFAVARDFFEVAINLNSNQLNAYYGLALALEGLGDVPGALGAMRSYVHLNKVDDAYLKKAMAAIWEWEATVAQQRGVGDGKVVGPASAPSQRRGQ